MPESKKSQPAEFPPPGHGADFDNAIRLRVVSRELSDFAAAQVPSELARLIPQSDHVVWLRDGQGMVAWGCATRIDTHGAERINAADSFWSDLVERSEVRDKVGLRGSGLIAFGSFAFSADSPAGGLLLVPRVILGRRDGRLWRTDICASNSPDFAPELTFEQWIDSLPETTVPELPNPSHPHLAGNAPQTAAGVVTFSDDMPVPEYHQLVARVGARIQRSTSPQVHKVVIARSLTATTTGTFDARKIVRKLTRNYPSTWVFSIDGLVGATPEMLLQQRGNRVESRVLAGTQPQSGVASDDARRREFLRKSTKDRLEHEYAVRSVCEILSGIGVYHATPDSPFILQLPNVAHLATDIHAELPPGQYSSLVLAGMLHPSAAVCGAPTELASQIIHDEEALDRDRYAGPVGWLNATGDGEWAIALRTARLSEEGRRATLYAGGGIMGASNPESEYLETIAKFQPMIRALDN